MQWPTPLTTLLTFGHTVPLAPPGATVIRVGRQLYKMRQKKETNLVEDRIEVGIGELGLDDGPEPEHRRGISGIQRLRLARPASDEATEFASARGDHRPRVSALGERARVVVVREDCPFDRVPVSLVGEVLTRTGEGSSGTTNRGESGKAALDDVEAVFSPSWSFVSGWRMRSSARMPLSWRRRSAGYLKPDCASVRGYILFTNLGASISVPEYK
jgi:hypothetical protein